MKNGSERVVDYARSHIAVIDMLKHFQYIDSNGKDQGINVRNRAKELIALLGDVNKIRTERKLAKSNRSKFSGISSTNSGGFGDSGNRYGGFGSDAGYGGYSGGVYGDGGGFGGSEYEGPGYTRDTSARPDDEFEEYQIESSAAASSSRSSRAPPPPAKSKQPVADLFSFDDEPSSTSSNPAPEAFDDEEDEFADFQSAAIETSSNVAGTSKPLPSQPKSDPLADLFSNAGSTTTTSASTFSSQPLNFSSLSFNSTLSSPTTSSNPASSYDAFGPLVGASGNNNTTSSTSTPGGLGSSSANSKDKAKSKADDVFSSLWTNSKATSNSNKSQAPLSSLAQKKAQDQIWGGSNSSSNNNLGGFGNSNNNSNSNGNNNNNNGGSVDLLSL